MPPPVPPAGFALKSAAAPSNQPPAPPPGFALKTPPLEEGGPTPEQYAAATPFGRTVYDSATSGPVYGHDWLDSQLARASAPAGPPPPPPGFTLKSGQTAPAVTDNVTPEPGFGDTLMNLGRGVGERFRQLTGGMSTTIGALGQQAAEEFPSVPSIVIGGEKGFGVHLQSAEDVKRQTESGQLGDLSEILQSAGAESQHVDLGYEPMTTWQDVKDEEGIAPTLAAAAKFALEQGVISAPDMAAVVANLPGYALARTGELSQSRVDYRAQQTGEPQEISGKDLAIGGGAAAVSSLLERFGVEKVLEHVPGLDRAILSRILKAGVAEGGTEAGQEVVEYAGERADQEAGGGMSLAEALDRAAGAAVGGAGAGIGIHAGAETLATAANAISPPKAPGAPPAPEAPESDLETAPLDVEAQQGAKAFGDELEATPAKPPAARQPAPEWTADPTAGEGVPFAFLGAEPETAAAYLTEEGDKVVATLADGREVGRYLTPQEAAIAVEDTLQTSAPSVADLGESPRESPPPVEPQAAPLQGFGEVPPESPGPANVGGIAPSTPVGGFGDLALPDVAANPSAQSNAPKYPTPATADQQVTAPKKPKTTVNPPMALSPEEERAAIEQDLETVKSGREPSQTVPHLLGENDELGDWQERAQRRLEQLRNTAPNGQPVIEGNAPERRAQRKKVAEMSAAELRGALLTHELTGIPNRRAYEEAPKKHSQTAIDVDSLKWVNDNMGHDSGNELLKAVGEALRAEGGPDVFHLSGDEFALQSNTDEEAAAAMQRINDRLAGAVISVTMPDGVVHTLSGMGVSYGSGKDLTAADARLQAHKTEREARGERSGRGVAPPGATSVAAEEGGADYEGGAPAGAEQEAARQSGTQRTAAGEDVTLAGPFARSERRDVEDVQLTEEESPKPPTAREIAESQQLGDESAESRGFKDATAALFDGTKNAPTIEWLSGLEGLPVELRGRMPPGTPGMGTSGLYDPVTNRVFLNTETIKDKNHARWVAAHEIAGHRGLRGYLAHAAHGAQARARIDAALELARQNPTVAALERAIGRRRGTKNLRATEEAIAELAAAARTGHYKHIEERWGVEVPERIRTKVEGVVARFVERVKAILRKLAGKEPAFTDEQVRELVEGAWRYVREGETAPEGKYGGEPAYIAAARDLRENDYSRKRALVALRQAYPDATIADLDGALEAAYKPGLGDELQPEEGDEHLTTVKTKDLEASIEKLVARQKRLRPGTAERIEIDDTLAPLISEMQRRSKEKKPWQPEVPRNLEDEVAAELVRGRKDRTPLASSAPASSGPQAAAGGAGKRYVQMYRSKGAPAKHPGPGARVVIGTKDRVKGMEIPAEPIHREHVMKLFQRLFKLKIYEGKPFPSLLKGRALGFFRPSNFEIRNRDRNDLEVAAHEVFHWIDRTYPSIRKLYHKRRFADELYGVSYDDTKIFEGFAEFGRLFMTQEPEAITRLPTFYEAFVKEARDAGILDKLEEVQKLMHQWYLQGAEARGRSKIGTAKAPIRQRLATMADGFVDRAIAASLDQLHAAKVIERATKGTIADDAAMSPYKSMRLLAGARSTINTFLNHGTLKWTARGDLDFSGKGLRQIFEPVHDVFDEAMGYFVAQRADELRKYGKENLFAPDEIAALRERAKASGKLEAIERAHEQYQAYTKRVLEFAEQSGILSAQSRATWEAMYQNYVPFYRVAEKFGSLDPRMAGGTKGGLFRRLTGGTANVADVFENITLNTALIVHASLKNVAKRQLFAAIESSPVGQRYAVRIPTSTEVRKVSMEQIERVLRQFSKEADAQGRTGVADAMEAAELAQLAAALGSRSNDLGQMTMTDVQDQAAFFFTGRPPTIPDKEQVLINGKPRWYQIGDPLLWDMLTGINYHQPIGVTEKVFGVAKRTLTRGVTITPEFQIANIIRDTFNAFAMSKGGQWPVVDALKGIRDVWKESDDYKLFLANGGGFGNAIGDEAKRLRVQLKATGTRRVLAMPSELIDFWDKWGQSFELATRLAEFKRVRDKGATMREAAFQGREVSTDFAMRGNSALARWASISLAFFNARLQGLYRIERELFEKKGRQSWTGERALAYASRALVGLTIPSLLVYWLFNRDDDDYEDLGEEVKSLNTVFPSPDGKGVLLVPRPFETGALFQEIPIRLWEYYRNRDGKKLARAAEFMIANTFNFNPVPQAVSPPIDVFWKNRQWNGLPVVPRSLENVEPREQFQPWTSETMKKIGEQFNVSPIKLEQLVNGYFGTLGLYMLGASDALVTAGGPDEPSKKLAQYPLFRRFMREQPYANTSFEQRFYDMLDETTKVVTTANKLRREARADDLDKYLSSTEKAIYFGLSKTAADVAEHAADLNAQMRAIRQNGVMTADAKSKEIDELQGEQNALFRDAVKELEAARLEEFRNALEGR